MDRKTKSTPPSYGFNKAARLDARKKLFEEEEDPKQMEVTASILESPPKRIYVRSDLLPELQEYFIPAPPESTNPPPPQYKPSPSTATNEMSWDEEGDDVEKALLEAAEKLEKKEQEKEKLQLENEKYRLLEDVTFPITRSENKFVTVGVAPLRGYEVVLKIHNGQLTAATCFDIDDFKQFVNKMMDYIACVEDVPGEKTVFQLKKYTVILCPNKVFKFKPKAEDVYRPLFLAVETVKYLLDLEDYLMNVMTNCEVKRTFYPDYDLFTMRVSTYVIDNGVRVDSSAFMTCVLDIIKERYESNTMLYEIVVKLPYNLRHSVNRQVKYLSDNTYKPAM